VRPGTPLSPAAIKVMLLGSGELGKEVIIELQRLGVETIAVDRYADAPGHQVAHRSHVIDMTDAKALRALVEQERPHLVVPEIEALATDELVRIEADGLCTVIPTARAAHITMNRERIRVLAAEELKLPTSPYAFCSSLEELQAAAAKIGFPCFVKPVMSSSGKGQSRLKSADDVAPAWEKALSAGRVREARVIVEGEIQTDRARPRRHPFLRAHRPCPEGWRLCGKLAAAADERCGAPQVPRYGRSRHRRAGGPGYFRRRAVHQGR
jgi:phosphoribosylglycinamide formyltransferase 2